MRFANPLLVEPTKTQPLRSGQTYAVSEASAFIRVEPEFLFSTSDVILELWQQGALVARKPYRAWRETIALFLPLAELTPGIYEVRISTAEGSLLQVHLEVNGPVRMLESAAFAGKIASCFYRNRYCLQAAPLEEMLSTVRNRLDASGAKLTYVTGSVGKTTTKELLAAAAKAQDIKLAKSSDSWNFPHEICSQIANNGWADFFLMEAALNSFMPLMGRLLPPDIFVFTEVGVAHTRYFSDLKMIAKQKMSLAAYMNPSGVIVANVGNPYIRAALEDLDPHCTVVSVSNKEEVPAAIQVEATNSHARIRIAGCDQLDVEFPPHVSPTNLACALAAYLRIDSRSDAMERFIHSVVDFPAVPGRLETTYIGRSQLINDAYNANPVSMKQLFDRLRFERTNGKRVMLVLGEMADLGEMAAEAHREVLCDAKTACDVLVAVGDAYGSVGEGNGFFFSDDHDNLLRFLKARAHEFDIIAVKGSNSTGLLAVPELLRRLNQ